MFLLNITFLICKKREREREGEIERKIFKKLHENKKLHCSIKDKEMSRSILLRNPPLKKASQLQISSDS